MTRAADELATLGWTILRDVPGLTDWVDQIRPQACAIASDPEQRSAWLRHGGTWFAGVNALPNDPAGRVAESPALIDLLGPQLRQLDLPTELDCGQISVTYPGYPRKDPTESEATHRFRVNRDAAHVDGLLPIGPERRRFLREPHAYVLGIPLTATDAGASPLVVWEGSHLLNFKNFKFEMARFPEKTPDMVDLTEAYHDIRFKIFKLCRRVVVHAEPGSAYLVHRLALHGVAPWTPGAFAPPEGRMIVYFRPELSSLEDWLKEL